MACVSNNLMPYGLLGSWRSKASGQGLLNPLCKTFISSSLVAPAKMKINSRSQPHLQLLHVHTQHAPRRRRGHVGHGRVRHVRPRVCHHRLPRQPPLAVRALLCHSQEENIDQSCSSRHVLVSPACQAVIMQDHALLHAGLNTCARSEDGLTQAQPSRDSVEIARPHGPNLLIVGQRVDCTRSRIVGSRLLRGLAHDARLLSKHVRACKQAMQVQHVSKGDNCAEVLTEDVCPPRILHLGLTWIPCIFCAQNRTLNIQSMDT